MKVKLATHVLSHTVSAAMLMSISLGTLPPSAAGTASEIISTFDQIFDRLNSSSLKASKIYRRPMSNNSPHTKFITEMTCRSKSMN